MIARNRRSCTCFRLYNRAVMIAAPINTFQTTLSRQRQVRIISFKVCRFTIHLCSCRKNEYIDGEPRDELALVFEDFLGAKSTYLMENWIRDTLIAHLNTLKCVRCIEGASEIARILFQGQIEPAISVSRLYAAGANAWLTWLLAHPS